MGGIAQPPMILSHLQYTGLKGDFMEEEFSSAQYAELRRAGKKIATASTDKSLRTVLLAVLFQVSWPKRLTRQEIIQQLPFETAYFTIARVLCLLPGS